MEDKVSNRLHQALATGIFPGCVVGVITKQQQFILPVGFQTYDEAYAVNEKTIYDIASLTKVMPTSSLALYLIDHNRLNLDQKVKAILPELQTNYVEEITVWHLLTQTLDFQQSLASYKDEAPEMILERIFTTHFPTPPGKKLTYSNATSVLLGLVVERVAGKSLDVLAQEVFFTPLGMESTSFHPDQLPKGSIVPTEDDSWRREIIRGKIHDESAYRLREIMIPGSAGLFSTVPDLLRFLQMILNKGDYKGQRILSRSIIKQMMTNQVENLGESGGLGWELNQPRFMGKYSNKHMIGKTGFTGCVMLCDVPKKRGMVMLSNYHYPKRKPVDELNSLRRELADIVFSL